MVLYYQLKYLDSSKNKIKVIAVAPSRGNIMPISAPSWTDFLICPICMHEFDIDNRVPITLACGHTICKHCLATLHRKQCPFDQANITKDLDNLPINYALLQLVPSSASSNNNTTIEHEILPSIIQTLTAQELQYYKSATRCIEELALYLKPSGNISALLSRPMQRKLVTLISCQLIEDEGRTRSLRAARSLGERTVTELILQHQNPQLLSTHLWAAVRARGCQFLGPAMQEEVLKLVLLALEDGSSLSRKVLVMYVVSKLVTTFPQASKTSIGHVVQLLYRASCFKVSKRESDSSLMTLKEEFRTYEALRREHDAQIVQIATEAGLRIAPDQWSALLYGDNHHKSHMQSIIDKQQSPQSFAQSVHELLLALQRTGDPANLSTLRNHMENLANIDASSEPSTIPTWLECANALDSVKQVVNGLIDFIQHHGNGRKIQENSYLQNTSRYKVSFCRELQNHGNCARGQNCNFAHSDEELERYRAKYKKNAMRNSVPSTSSSSSHNQQINNSSINNGNNQMKESTNFNASSSNGPNQKVNMNHHSTFAKNNNNLMNNNNSNQDAMRFNKSMSYRSEHSLATPNNHHHHHNNNNNYHHGSNHHHLKPSNAYGNSSSTSTPNLSLPLSPNQQKIHSPNPRFAFNGNSPIYNNNNSPSNGNSYSPNNYVDNSHGNLHPQAGKFMGRHRPPLSAPPIPQQNFVKSPDYKKQLSPYHLGSQPTSFPSPTHMASHHYGAMKTPPNGSNNNNNNNNGNNNSPSGYYGTHFFNSPIPHNNSNNDECNTSSSSSASFGDPQNKFAPWNRSHNENKHQPKSPNLMPKSPTLQPFMNNKGNYGNSSPNTANRFDVSQSNHDYNKQRNVTNVNHMMNVPQSNFGYQQQPPKNVGVVGDEIDGMWNYQYQQPHTPPQQIMKSSASYQFAPPTNVMNSGSNNKDKFIRSDSILTSNTDDSYDNLPTNGKFGAIGLKNNSNTNIGSNDGNLFKANQWSGLNNIDNFDIGSGGASAFDTKKSDDAHINLNIGGNSNQNSQHRLNGNFLNIGDIIQPSPSSSCTTFWANDSLQSWNDSGSSTGSIKGNSELDSLNDMWKVLDLIDK